MEERGLALEIRANDAVDDHARAALLARRYLARFPGAGERKWAESIVRSVISR